MVGKVSALDECLCQVPGSTVDYHCWVKQWGRGFWS